LALHARSKGLYSAKIAWTVLLASSI